MVKALNTSFVVPDKNKDLSQQQLVDPNALMQIALNCDNDCRRALNILENSVDENGLITTASAQFAMSLA